MRATPQSTVGRWAEPLGPYALVSETLNCGVPDLLIEFGRSAVVDSFHTLARDSQESVKLHPNDLALQKFACSLAWHYVRLREATQLDAAIKTASASKKRADALSTVVDDLEPRFERAIHEVEALEQFVKWQPLRAKTPIWKEPPRKELLQGLLAPSTLAQLPIMAKELTPVEVLDGIIIFLGRAPWVERKMPAFFEEYFADPAQRLEFVAACDALLPTIKSLRNDLKKRAGLQKALAEKSSARTLVADEWNCARQGAPIPPFLADLVKSAMGLDRLKAP